MKNTAIIGIFCFLALGTNAQGFHFGANISGISSQIEGDKLSGFHHFGYSLGLIGGYTFNNEHYLIIGPQYSFFGSNRKGERFPHEGNKVLIEMGLNTINVLCGYSYRFGDSWIEEKKYRLNAGARIHRLINSDANIVKSGVVGVVAIDEKGDLRSFFVTLEFGAGINLSRTLGLELSYNHSLHNILKNQKVNVTKLSPLYLSLGLSYYFFK